MVIYVKNSKLKARIFKTMNRYDRLALKFYKKGKMAQGKKYEHKSDRLYAKYYHQMFGRR